MVRARRGPRTLSVTLCLRSVPLVLLHEKVSFQLGFRFFLMTFGADEAAGERDGTGCAITAAEARDRANVCGVGC